MPWTFRLSLASLFIFVIGAAVIVNASMTSGWEAIGRFAWGVLISGTGLMGSAFFSILCAVRNPKSRKASAAMFGLSILLLIGLFLFAKSA